MMHERAVAVAALGREKTPPSEGKTPPTAVAVAAHSRRPQPSQSPKGGGSDGFARQDRELGDVGVAYPRLRLVGGGPSSDEPAAPTPAVTAREHRRAFLAVVGDDTAVGRSPTPSASPPVPAVGAWPSVRSGTRQSPFDAAPGVCRRRHAVRRRHRVRPTDPRPGPRPARPWRAPPPAPRWCCFRTWRWPDRAGCRRSFRGPGA